MTVYLKRNSGLINFYFNNIRVKSSWILNIFRKKVLSELNILFSCFVVSIESLVVVEGCLFSFPATQTL